MVFVVDVDGNQQFESFHNFDLLKIVSWCLTWLWLAIAICSARLMSFVAANKATWKAL